MNASQAAMAYRTVGMTTTSGVGLVVQAYELTLDHLTRLAQAMDEGNRAEKAQRLSRAMTAVMELRAVLDRDQGGEIADGLDRLYDYFIRLLVEANLEDDASKVREVARHWAELTASWRTMHTRSHT